MKATYTLSQEQRDKLPQPGMIVVGDLYVIGPSTEYAEVANNVTVRLEQINEHYVLNGQPCPFGPYVVYDGTEIHENKPVSVHFRWEGVVNPFPFDFWLMDNIILIDENDL